jgi:phosphatidylinositol-3-phosphatase
MRTVRIAALAAGVVSLVAGLGVAVHDAGAAVRPALPRPDHVVVLIEENHAYSQVIGKAPYLTGLSKGGALFTASFAVRHPSEPNYVALFSGSTRGITDDSCPHTFTNANLGSRLIAAHLTFAGYSESMPSDGYTGCTSGKYARKHNPWSDFSNVPASANLRFTRFPTDFTKLPTVSFVVPNLADDMHDGTVTAGDNWAKAHLDAYAQWARTHNSLLVVTFDEDDDNHGNRIATVLYGQPVKTGTYAEHITHYSVLRTIEDLYGLACTGNACSATTIADVWK